MIALGPSGERESRTLRDDLETDGRPAWPSVTLSMDSVIKHTAGGIPRSGKSCSGAHTLVEVITVVMILSILACVAIPRFSLGAVWKTQARATALQIMTDLRRARSHAILHAAENPDGFALVMNGPPGQYSSYQVIDLRDSTVIADYDIPPNVRCSGGGHFEFGPLGNLKDGSDTELRVSVEDRRRIVSVVPATGMVRCTEQ